MTTSFSLICILMMTSDSIKPVTVLIQLSLYLEKTLFLVQNFE